MTTEKQDNPDSGKLERTLECSACGGTETIILEEDVIASGDKVYPSGSALCAKCRTPTMVTVYRWNRKKE